MNKFEIAAHLNGNPSVMKQAQDDKEGFSWDKLEDWTADRAMDVYDWLPEEWRTKARNRAMKKMIMPKVREYGPEALGTLAGMALGGTLSGEGHRLSGAGAGGTLGFLIPWLMSNDWMNPESVKTEISPEERENEEKGPDDIDARRGKVGQYTDMWKDHPVLTGTGHALAARSAGKHLGPGATWRMSRAVREQGANSILDNIANDIKTRREAGKRTSHLQTKLEDARRNVQGHNVMKKNKGLRQMAQLNRSTKNFLSQGITGSGVPDPIPAGASHLRAAGTNAMANYRANKGGWSGLKQAAKLGLKGFGRGF